jgi:hypothetical protein
MVEVVNKGFPKRIKSCSKIDEEVEGDVVRPIRKFLNPCLDYQ